MYLEGSARVGLIALSIVVSIAVAAVNQQGMTTAGLYVLGLCFLGFVVIRARRGWHWTGPGRQFAARAMAHAGTCPSCGYGIASVPKDDDGLTTCPECASVWRVA